MPMALTSLGIFYPLTIQHEANPSIDFFFLTLKNITFM
jgi:hypothetical protein